LQVGGVKALGEPAINRCQQRPRFGLLTLLLPQARQAGGGAQLPEFGLLAAGDVQGLLETGLCLRLLPGRACQREISLQPRQLCLIEPPLGVVDGCPCLSQDAEPLVGLPRFAIHLGQQDKLIRPVQL